MLKFAAMSRLCSSRFERAARKLGWTRIAGLDEAGRGSLFGPVVAAAVILNPKRRIVGLDDSKQGSERFAYASRDDVHEGLRKSLPHDVALANAPDSDGTFFKVPKVIER